jgi:hypothetical protein
MYTMTCRAAHRFYRLSLFAVYAGAYGAAIGFLVVVGDLLHPVAVHALGHNAFVASRAVIIPAFALAVVFPLLFCRTFHGCVMPEASLSARLALRVGVVRALLPSLPPSLPPSSPLSTLCAVQ